MHNEQLVSLRFSKGFPPFFSYSSPSLVVAGGWVDKYRTKCRMNRDKVVDSSFIFIRRYKNSLDLNVHCYRGSQRCMGHYTGVVGWINANVRAGNFVNRTQTIKRGSVNTNGD